MEAGHFPNLPRPGPLPLYDARDWERYYREDGVCSRLTATYRHLRGMSHLLIAPSKWDTSMGALKLKFADVNRFLDHNLAAVGQRSGASEGVSRDPVLANVDRPGTALSG